MKKLLTIKHWELFILFMGFQIIFEVVIIGSIISGDTSSMVLFPIMMILLIGLFIGWFYTLGTNLHKKLPAIAEMNLTKFKIFLSIPALYIFSIMTILFNKFSNHSPGESTNFFHPGLIIPLHLFSMFCIFYCLYFNAKALKSVELQKPVTFSDFAGEFFLFWFFPIGIWILQPRINKLFESKPNVTSQL